MCRVPKAAVDAALSYCHNNLADNTITTLLPYLAEKEVALISASFSSMGLLTQKVGLGIRLAKIQRLKPIRLITRSPSAYWGV